MIYEYNIRRILSHVRRAVDDYGMIQPHDSIAVGVSGGKDSLALLVALATLQKFYPIPFSLRALSMDPGFHKIGVCDKETTDSEYNAIGCLCDELNVPFTKFDTDIAKIVFDVRKEKNPCSLCARMRRGALHENAKALCCNKIALGHHFDDAVETFMMNLFNEGRLGCFSPVTYLDRRDITVIRPLIYTKESTIRYFISHSNLPLITGVCPQDKTSDREKFKQLLSALDRENKGLKYRIFGAMQRAGLDGYRETKNAPYAEHDDTE